MSFAQDLLKRAKVQLEAANELFEGSFPIEQEKRQAAAIVAKITGNIYQVLAEFLINQEASGAQTEAQKRRNAILERSNAIRAAHVKAIESGDWTEYDKLCNGILAGATGAEGSSGDEGGP